MDATVQKFGKVDILVLNAGSLLQNGGMKDLNEEVFERLMTINVKGPLFLAKVSASPPLSSPILPLCDCECKRLTWYQGCSPAHPHRRPHPLLLHLLNLRLRNHAQLPPLRRHERRNRAGLARTRKGRRLARHHGQRHLPRPHGHGRLLRGQERADCQDDCIVKSGGEDRHPGGDRERGAICRESRE